jgi:fructoselysine-6-P-deglycase FrlB-like protein
VVCFSHRGGSVYTQAWAAYAKEQGALVIQVSADDVPMWNDVDELLPFTPLEKIEPHTFSVSGAVVGVSTLFSDKIEKAWVSIIKKTSKADFWNGLQHEVSKFVRSSPPAFFLGHSEGTILADEASLKFLEIAGHLGIASPAEDFFHGLKWALNKNDEVWLIATSSAAEEFRQKLLALNHTKMSILELPKTESPESMLHSLIVIQLAALSLARKLKVDPDRL